MLNEGSCLTSCGSEESADGNLSAERGGWEGGVQMPRSQGEKQRHGKGRTTLLGLPRNAKGFGTVMVIQLDFLILKT